METNARDELAADTRAASDVRVLDVITNIVKDVDDDDDDGDRSRAVS